MSGGMFADCTLSAYTGEPRTCEWCAKPLQGRQVRWCSTECGDTAWANHAWNNARSAAIRRDENRCVQCGSDGVNHEARGWIHFLEVVCLHPDPQVLSNVRMQWRDVADAHLAPLGPVPEPSWGSEARSWYKRAQAIEMAWMGDQYPQQRWWRLFHQLEEAVWRTEGLEVNHITPVLGRHSINGCHHHLGGLETLCIPHHRAVTAAQRAAGAFGAAKAPYPAENQPALFEESHG